MKGHAMIDAKCVSSVRGYQMATLTVGVVAQNIECCNSRQHLVIAVCQRYFGACIVDSTKDF